MAEASSRVEKFVAEREERWKDLAGLVRSAGRSPRRLEPDEVRRLGSLYRAVAGDLAMARRRFPGESVVGRLEGLVRDGRSAVYSYESPGAGVRHFLHTGYWRRVRERPGLLVASLVLLFAPWILSSLWAQNNPGAASGLAPSGVESVIYRDSADFALSADEKAAAASGILTHNIQVSFLVFVAGIAAGIGAAFVLVYQGVALGATFGLTIQAGNAPVLWEFVMPHGVLELSCIAVAGVAGMRMGWALVSPGHRTRISALQAEARPATEIAIGTALCLVVAGLVEGLVSTSGIGIPLGLVIGIGLGVLYWGAVIWRGRPAPAVATVGATRLRTEPTVRPASI